MIFSAEVNMKKVKLRELVDILDLEIVHKSSDYDEVVIESRDINRPGLQLVGYMARFPYERLQLIGQLEYD